MKLRSFSIGLLLSVLLHLMFVGGVTLLSLRKPPTAPEAKTVTIEILDQKPEPLPTEIVKKAKTKLDTNNQIVEQDEKSLNNETPDDARFLSAKNQKVLKQTQAINRGEFQNEKAKTAKGSQQKEAKKAAPDINKLLGAYDPMAAMKKQEAMTKSEAEQQKGGNVSQSNDYLKDVDRGLETLLNTREFKYYTYYTRIRKQLSQHWEGKVREKVTKITREGRTIASSSDRITKLLIVLNSAGTLVKVQVLSDSGIRDLDDAAIEAFRAAAPFPNPPKGIIESDGTVKIRWDFVLES